jgi:hypothetical protein
MNEYLKRATDKFKTNRDIDLGLNLVDYICECYTKLNPCSYGSRIENKIKKLINVKTVKKKENKGDFKYGDKYGEIKISFLSQTNCYNITHIRLYQGFDCYLFCFIDCEEMFTPNFYLIPKNVMNKLQLTSMNGTEETNMGNKNVDQRVTIKKDSKEHKLIIRHNLLSGTTINDLNSYINPSL